MTKKAAHVLEQTEAADKLRAWCPAGSTVYTILRHVSKSGMSRVIGVVVMTPEGPIHPNYATADLLGLKMSTGSGDGVKMSGCGMDMGFALVYELSHKLYPKGFGCIGKNCPSNDHSNGDRDYTPGPEHWHRDGGYALRQRWL